MKRALTICLIVLISICKTFAQTKAENYDVILKTSGDEMVGKITAIDDSSIKFVYKGETLVYTVSKADIFRVTFASGRVEIFNQPNKPANQTPAQAAAVDSHNQVAILPFGLIRDGMAGAEDMQIKIQSDCFDAFSQKAVTLKFQDPSTTNALLFKNNINNQTIKGHTMDEICQILGVEFVVNGVVTLNRTSSTTTGSGSATAKTTTSGSKDKTTVYGSNYSNSYDNYTTSIVMNVYDEHGSKVFSKDHQAFWPGVDAYKVTLSYLAKRTPIYGR
ncbi:hypothetical protein [Mucilaginibacter agri]|uniref:Uncharacterized protein n=1 Tax=Mucilaginibacter agri TaxID=2695265 RepID=A0A965ZEJ6_9SPHI|nr:hypothetical protein [Mucilaginibacter agri]NCD68607.1 hypothetical protein [Mucilaginibacter agri]